MTLGLVSISHPAQEESSAAQQEPAAWWAFETVNEEGAFEQKAGIFDSISGHYKLVAGVHGRALKLDGFTKIITRKKERAPHFTSFFSLEAWALGLLIPVSVILRVLQSLAYRADVLRRPHAEDHRLPHGPDPDFGGMDLLLWIVKESDTELKVSLSVPKEINRC